MQLFTRPPLPTERIELPGVQVVVQHSIKTVWVYFDSPVEPEGLFADLEQHLREQGYLIQPFISTSGGQKE